ncbi:MAG: UDP-4-amino-4,6-dideoxy-N-acetyl-beta-L-altrosamine transaminase [Candidatus Hatepunaea meridiana]|nr:UDP-4-amino-4,6-dideoxy-N-acetyl-beta-L-altrosamine transaminase [Candidatus Hatepunaea meridiana]
MKANINKLAIDGGVPVRKNLLSYGRQSIDEGDIKAVVEALRSDWLTTGPSVTAFEEAFAEFVGTRHAVAVNSGTAALHASIFAVGLKPGDEAIIPTITFAASAICVVFQGATPIFADVDPDTLLLDPDQIEEKLTPRTKAVIAVDYTGQPCDYDRIKEVCLNNELILITDSCHAVGAKYNEQMVGSIGDLAAFSFHPVKHLTTGEGGMITTDDAEYAERMRRFRNHNIASDFHQRAEAGSWFYEVVDLGYNYRLTDFQCALGLSQLRKITSWVNRRREIAKRYDEAFADIPAVQPLEVSPKAFHSYHLYIIRLDLAKLNVDRGTIFQALRAEGIGVNVHYIPAHLHPFYKERFNTGLGQCPVAEEAYDRIITLPMFPAMSDGDVEDVINAVTKVGEFYKN